MRSIYQCGFSPMLLVRTSVGLVLGLLFACSAKADLFVVNESQDILRFNSTTGTPVQTNGQDVFASLVNAAGIAIGPDGLIYVSTNDPSDNSNNAFVNRYNPGTGQTVGAGFVKEFNPPQYFLTDPHGIAFGPDGHLYVADQSLDGVLKVFDSSGTFVTSYKTQVDSPEAVAFDPALPDNVYVATGNTIESFNLTTHADVVIAESPNGFQNADDLTFGPDGELYVLDTTAIGPQVLRYNPDGTGQTVFASFNSFEPRGFAFGPDGLLYVAGILDSQDGEILQLSPDGSPSVFVSGIPIDGLQGPAFIAFTNVPEPNGFVLIGLAAAAVSLRRHDGMIRFATPNPSDC